MFTEPSRLPQPASSPSVQRNLGPNGNRSTIVSQPRVMGQQPPSQFATGRKAAPTVARPDNSDGYLPTKKRLLDEVRDCLRINHYALRTAHEPEA